MHEPSKTMYAATYGRSAYKIDIAGNILNTGNLNTQNDITLYPNPASSAVTLSIPSITSDYVMNIFDQSGRKVFEKRCTQASVVHQIPLDKFTSGIYFVSIKAGEKVVIKKLMVE